MKLRSLIFAALVLFAVPASAQTDMIAFTDPATVKIVNAPDVRNWPVTTALTSMSFSDGVTRVEFTKKDGPGRWPDVTPAGWSGPLEYTLWLCVKTPGWTCSAFIQFWNGRDGSGSAGDPDVPSVYHNNWYYSSRWAPIYGHGAIQPGEVIGFLVTSGNQRDSVGPNSVAERSNVVILPATDNGTFTFGSLPLPPIPPVPPTPVPPVPPSTDLAALTARVVALEAAVGQLQSGAVNIVTRLQLLESKPIPTTCTVQAIGVRFACRLQ